MKNEFKSCWICKNLDYLEGFPGYSEYTPPVKPSMLCERNHKLFDFYSGDVKAEAIRKANSCKDFEVAKDE